MVKTSTQAGSSKRPCDHLRQLQQVAVLEQYTLTKAKQTMLLIEKQLIVKRVVFSFSKQFQMFLK